LGGTHDYPPIFMAYFDLYFQEEEKTELQEKLDIKKKEKGAQLKHSVRLWRSAKSLDANIHMPKL